MSPFLVFGLANAVCAAVLALVALLVGCFCRRPAVLHSLWLLVLLKLVTPPCWPVTVAQLSEAEEQTSKQADPEITAVNYYPVALPSAPVTWNEEAIIASAPARFANKAKDSEWTATVSRTESTDATASFTAANTFTYVTTPSQQPAPSMPAPDATEPQGLASCVPLLCLAWATGVVVWLAWAALRIGRFQRLLRHARRAEPDVQQQADNLAAQMGLSRSPEIWLLPGSLPPLVWGAFGRVRIFFPAKLLVRLNDTGRGSLLAHELAHVRRRDHWVRWLELFASALYWWYPLVWLAQRRLHVHEEECCDAWVIDEVPPRAYAGAILNTLDFIAEDRDPLPMMASGLSGVALMKRRLSLIMDGGVPKRLSVSMRFALLVFGLLLLSLRPSIGQTKQEKQKPVEEATTTSAPAAPQEEATVFNDQPKNLLGGNNDVWSTAFSPNGKYLVTGSGYWDRSGEVSVWDVAMRKRLRIFPETLGVASVAVSPDGKRMASAGWTREARLRDLASGKEIAKLALDSVARVAFSPDGKLLATASEGKTVKLWDGQTGKEVANLQGEMFRFHCVTFSRDGKLVAAGGGDWDQGGVSQATLWDVKSHKQVGKLTGHERPILAMCFSPDNKFIATGGVDNSVKLWDAASYKLVASLDGHENWVECVQFSPDGKHLVSAGQDASVRVWDVQKHELLSRLEGFDVRARSTAFSPDGKLLATGGANKTLQLWDTATYKEIAALQKGSAQGNMAPPILNMVCAPDGKTLATALDDQTIQLLDTATGDPQHTLTGHKDAVQCLAYSPDGKLLASGSPDNSVCLWDTANGALRRTMTGHKNWVYAVAFAPDGKTLASASYDQTIRLWDTASGEERRLLKGHKGSIRALKFSPDGKMLASAGSDQNVHLWPMNGEGEPSILRGHEDTIRALAFSPDGKTLASGGDDQTIKLWDVASKKERSSLKGHMGEIITLAFSPQGKTLASGAGDNVVIVWDPATGALRKQLRGHSEPVTSVVFTPDGQQLISASLDRTIKVWSPVAPPQQARLTLQASKDRTWAIAFSPDNRMFATISGKDKQGELKLWQTENGKANVDLKETHVLRCLAYSPDGKILATGSFDNNVQLREAATGKVLQTLKGHKGGINSLSFSPDGRILLTGSLDKTAKLWDLPSGKERRTLEGHDDWILSVAFAPDGKTVATASKDRTARIWSIADGKVRLTLEGHTAGIEGLAYAPDGRTVATASWDHTVRLWDTASGQLRRQLQGQQMGFMSVAFAPDGKTIATAGGQFPERVPGELRLWDASSGKVLRVLQGHAGGIWCVRFSPDGKTLASAGDDGIVKLWTLTPQPMAGTPQPTTKKSDR